MKIFNILNKLFNKKKTNKSKKFLNSDKIDKSVKSDNLTTIITSTESEDTFKIPPFQEIYAKAVFLNTHIKASPLKESKDYESYLVYECGIEDPRKYHEELISEGYFEKSNLKDILNNITVVNLKKWLSELGQPVSGKKEILIERLVSSTEEEVIYNYINIDRDAYSLSEKGKEFLKKYKAYIQIHDHPNWNITWEEFNEEKRKLHQINPAFTDNDVFWGIFNDRVRFDYRYAYYCMYELLAEEKNRSRTIEMLLRVVFIDINCIEFFRGVHDENIFLDKLFTINERLNNDIFVSPSIIKKIKPYKDVYDDKMVDRLYELESSITLLSKEQFLKFIYSVFDGTYNRDKLREELKESCNRLKNEILNLINEGKN